MYNPIQSKLPLMGAVIIVLVMLSTSQSTVLYSSVSKSQLTVGDKVLFSVIAVAPKGAVLTPPAHDNSFGDIVIKEWNMQRLEREKSDSITFEYIITTYIPENCTIPALPFIQEHDNKLDTLYSESIPLQIISVITASDSVVELRDLKPQQKAGNPPLWWLWLSLSIAALAAVLLGAKILLKRLRKPFAAPPPKPPYEEAIEALRDLDCKQLIEKGLIREYVFLLSEIFKRYIGRRFEVNASDFTTEEMNSWIKISGLETKLRRTVEWFFNAADPVKFARHIPDSDTTGRFGKEVWNFVEQTRPSLGTSKEAESLQGGESR